MAACVMTYWMRGTMADLPWDSKSRRAKNDGKYVRERSADPYHTYRWTALSRAFRASHPLCAECQRKGIIREATCVDHIIPWPICADRFFDRSNLQSLCDDCNQAKGNRDKAMIQQWKREHPF